MKLFSLLAALILTAHPAVSYGAGSQEPINPCQTFEPECSNEWGTGDDNDRDGDGEPERPADPEGPDYVGEES